MTTEEIAELERLRKEQQPSSVIDPNSLSASTQRSIKPNLPIEPGLTPPTFGTDPTDYLVNLAVPGGSAIKAGVKGLVGAADSVADNGLGMLLGVPSRKISQYMENPALARQYQNASNEAAQQGIAKGVIDEARQNLRGRSDSLRNIILSKTNGKTINSNMLPGSSQIGKVSPEAASLLRPDLVTGEIPTQNVLASQTKLGKDATSWVFDPKTQSLVRSSNPEAGNLYGKIGNVLKKEAPELTSTRGAIKTGIDAQDALGAVEENELGFLNGQGDTAATRQSIGDISKSPIETHAKAYQSGQAIRSLDPKGFQAATQMIGKPLLAARGYIEPVVKEAIDKTPNFLYGSLDRTVDPLQKYLKPKRGTNQLNEQELAELERLRKSQGE